MSERAEYLGPAKLRVELRDDGLWELISPLVFRSKVLDRTFVAEIGFRTDFASVPRLPGIYLIAANRCYKAAVLHDKALEEGMARDKAAALFLEAMEAEGVPESLRMVMHAAVRLHDQSHRPGPDYFPPPGD